MDIRDTSAQYYDLNPDIPEDIPFYLGLIPPDADVLELGCGTGRVTVPLAGHCRFVQGVDLSPAMLRVCQERLQKAGIPPEKGQVQTGDITRLTLGRRFDWIIAPFRVMQNLETDAQVDGLFQTIHAHLKPGGQCVLNVFHPNRDPQGLRDEWVNPQEQPDWEKTLDGDRVVCTWRAARMDKEKLILYPELIYRRYRGDRQVDEAVMKFVMRCWYPEPFAALVESRGFQIVNRWGGYHDEPYGAGLELVLQFTA